MLPELYSLADVLGDQPTTEQLRVAVVRDNVLARPSLSARTKVVKKLQQRYFPPADSSEWPLLLRALRQAEAADDRALVACATLAANDALFRTLNISWLAPRLAEPGLHVQAGDVLDALDELGRQHADVATWGESTRQRVARHYLGALRDFGFARGRAKKHIARPHVGPATTHYACDLLLERAVPVNAIPGHDLLRALGMDLDASLEALHELDRLGLARFRVQGGVVELRIAGAGRDG